MCPYIYFCTFTAINVKYISETIYRDIEDIILKYSHRNIIHQENEVLAIHKLTNDKICCITQNGLRV